MGYDRGRRRGKDKRDGFGEDGYDNFGGPPSDFAPHEAFQGDRFGGGDRGGDRGGGFGGGNRGGGCGGGNRVQPSKCKSENSKLVLKYHTGSSPTFKRRPTFLRPRHTVTESNTSYS